MCGVHITYSNSFLPPAEMKPLQMSVLENQAAKLEAMSTTTRKRRRVSFAPEPQTTHKSEDVVITKVVEGNKDLRALPDSMSGREQSTKAVSPHVEDIGVLGALLKQGVSSRPEMESTGDDVGSKNQFSQHWGNSPPRNQAESPIGMSSFTDVATPCVSSRHGQKHSESPPDRAAKQVNPPIHFPEIHGHSTEKLSDEESVASSVSSADMITGKRRRGGPRGVKSREKITAEEARVRQKQKQQEAVKEVVEKEVEEKEVEGMALRTRKRQRRKTRGRKTVMATTAMTEEAEEGERERESETGEGLGVGETKKRRLTQDDEPQPTPETARGESLRQHTGRVFSFFSLIERLAFD